MKSLVNKGAELDYLFTKRPPAQGTKGAVASPHYLATQAGQEAIKKGGHAVVDGAIVINSVLAVVYPHMAGLGGDLMGLVWDKKTKEVEEFNGSGRTGKDISREL